MKNKILTILLSVAIAFGLWLYVITYEYTQIEYTFYNVEVQLLGESVLQDRGLMIASDSERTVDLTISGKRSDISKLKSSDITVLVDLTAIHEAGERTLSYDVSFPGDVQNSALEIVRRSPESIRLTIANWETKEISVETETLGTPAEGFIVDVDGITVSHKTVSISGPKELLDKIQIGKVAVDMEGAKETKEQSVKLTLCDKDGNPVDGNLTKVVVATSKIQVKVPVLMQKEIELLLPVIPGGGLTEEDVEKDMSADRIIVTGSPAVISKLPGSITLGQIDLAKETQSFTKREYYFELPSGVNIEGNLGTTVFVSLTLPETDTLTLTVPNTQITVTGTPAGYEADPGGTLEVTLRGIKGAFNGFKTSDVSVVVDVAGATTTGRYNVEIQIQGDMKIGAVENDNTPYTIYVLFTELEA
jgi:YbbR domain-containing protein